MMNVNAVYAEKCVTPDEAVTLITSGSHLSMGMFAAEPPALLNALAKRAKRGEINDLRVYCYETASIAGNTIFRYELSDYIHLYSMFITGIERALIRQGIESSGRKIVNYVPSNFHQATRLLADDIGIDTFIHTVSPMDKYGYFNFGTGNDYSTRIARTAKKLIVEVNKYMPRVHGEGAAIHISEIDAIVENHVPLIELPIRTAVAEDIAISQIIASLVPDGACLQMGVGALPELICNALKEHNDLGVHTEALNPGLVSLIQQGVALPISVKISTGECLYLLLLWDKRICMTISTTTPLFLVGLSIMLTIRGSLRKMRMLSPLTLPYKSISLVPVTLNICLDTSTALQEGNWILSEAHMHLKEVVPLLRPAQRPRMIRFLVLFPALRGL